MRVNFIRPRKNQLEEFVIKVNLNISALILIALGVGHNMLGLTTS